VLLKKYFYAIRSALVIEWLRTHDEPVPPMNLLDLLEQSSIERAMHIEVAWLLSKKLVTSELGTGPRLPATDAFIFRYDTNNPLPATTRHPDELIARYDSVLRRAMKAS
jgi:predicted nucleotidyltransferase